MFALHMEPYAMIQVSILLSVINQMGSNFASMFYFCFGRTTGSHSRNSEVPRDLG